MSSRSVGIREGRTRGGVIEIIVERRDEGLEIRRGFGQGRAPERPVRLGQAGARVKRQTIILEHRLVEGNLPLGDLGREDVEAENAVPDQVVFLAPGVGPVEGEPVMVAFGGDLHPMLGVRLGQIMVLRGVRRITAHAAQIAVSGQAEDGFDGEVGVVGQVAHEVIGAELVFGVQPYCSRYRAHCVNFGHQGETKSALPSACAMASQRMSMLPLSSTGMPSPPSSVPRAMG